MKKGSVKSLLAMLCVTAVGIVPVGAAVKDVVSTSASTSTSTSISVSVSAYSKGDANGDGYLTLEDAQLTLGAALGIQEEKYMLNDLQKFAADMDEDGTITLADAQLALKAALGIN